MEETKASGRLEAEIREARQMSLNSFPSFAVVAKDQIIHINLDYENPQKMATEIQLAVQKIV